MQLSDAISAAEQASNAYTSASAATAADQTSVDNIQSKLDAAKNQVASDQQAQDAAAVAFNTSLDSLIEAATVAKIPVAQVQTQDAQS